MFLRSLIHKLHVCFKKMSQCHNFVSGTSTLCLQSQQLFFSLSFSFWDCKQNEEIPDTKLWHCGIFFKHLCNLWNKDPKKIWYWIRSIEQFVVLTMCYTKKEQNYLCYAIILIKSHINSGLEKKVGKFNTSYICQIGSSMAIRCCRVLPFFIDNQTRKCSSFFPIVILS